MKKNKRDLMILMVIIFIGINYAVYTYFIKNQLHNLNSAENKYLTTQKDLDALENKQESINVKAEEIKTLKQKTAVLDTMAPKNVNTPQLIYDFYTNCKKFGITGRSISFQLLNSQSGNSFHTLTINLKISGNREKIESFIKNLDGITDRKINVKSITIYIPDYENTSKYDDSSTGNDSINIWNNADSRDINSAENSKASNIVGGEIVFYEYIQGNGNSKYPDNYVFYDSEKEGLNSIADMFK
ncbi:type 4a pilus biogenesis protein PilO [Clostridium tyrobutyricum]|uniref:type 4a pilus biogenesis protein PilO n=1 Tax=Clostridium tyrobutyricum TaxID=1519 RepID=UPI00073D7A15|nr:type 4a pilus biogenesis protein PilO [Clostridium tyrobutyricum]